ncbi:RIP metalloprotease RseP [Flavobacterium sp.]|uniref:RIP metalloprotease RseP n=1 Tax=Flavobacterium sp. TaxID=239 RepID=UPI0035286B97
MIQVAQILFILSVLVILHEFGHYITAKWFKVRVEKFYLFMDAGFSLVKKKIGETEWGIGWLPLGGYVKLSGMIDESMDTEQMQQEPQPWEFRAKPAWQRLIIMLGGIIVNILLAWLIYTVMYTTVGKKYVATEVLQQNGLAFGEVGKAVGFQDGDKIVSVDGKFQENFGRMAMDILFSHEVKVDRNGEIVTLNLTDEQIKEIISKEGRDFIQPRTLNKAIDSVFLNSQAQKAGLQIGDSILSVNGKKAVYFDELTSEMTHHKNDSIALSVYRNNQVVNVKAKVDSTGMLGFRIPQKIKTDFAITQKMSIGEAIPAAIKESWNLLVYNVKSFKLILRPSTGAYKQVKSPVGIARMLPDAWDWEFIWNFTAFFSIALAFMNLLPIPGLDGGHALFTIVEMITGKTLSVKAMEKVQTFGMIILLTLMVLTFGKDIYELVIDKFFK